MAGAHNGADWWTGALALAAVLPSLWLIARGETERGLTDWLVVVGGVLYVGWLGSYLVPLRQLDDDGQWVFLAVFAAFANDTGAYFVGMAVGRTPLAPRISPSKTVEGSLGGLICGAAAVPAAELRPGPGHRRRAASSPWRSWCRWPPNWATWRNRS